ncbi:hypothetical protein M413DRAFT_105950 [Hebeloma cylindrosporum]|uniref:GATA-type domain-containing protein n=1 Tax=Hebeloma cylindrosporum TaxID=76867 RepID=A0A0C3CYX3_HEBCY|nr:hypothetical protein M413DRAFT_105950 [Hebeloma cylindrosporum h7]
MSAPIAQQSSSFGTKPSTGYEFPKRKRWADLILTELVDVVVFIVSPACKILYCGAAITEILGWRDIDLIDLDFSELIDEVDQPRFHIAFEESVLNSIEANLTLKLKANGSSTMGYQATSPRDTLFDVKFYPHGTTEDEPETKCIFAMAVPYPNRNTTMLNTMPELKVENERLQLMVDEMRSRGAGDVPTSQTPQSGSMYATCSLNPLTHAPASNQGLREPPAPHHPPSVLISGVFNGGPGTSTDTLEPGKVNVYNSISANPDDHRDEGSKKKKLKRTQNAEQYVCITCGRTDSPEWRKGPLGPKTLCNACGLRWAKQMRKADEPGEGQTSSTNSNNS